MLSYTVAGGIFNKLEIDIPKYSHPLNKIKSGLKAIGLNLLSLNKGTNISSHVPYQIANETYEFLIKKSL